MKGLVSTLFLLLLPFGILAQEIPDFSANYLVKLNGLQAGELKRRLTTNADGSRQFKSATKAKGIFSFFKPDLVEETSTWQFLGSQIRPQHYLYERTGGKKDKYMSLQFDWPTNQLYIDDKKQPWQLKLEHGTLDKLVYQLALMSDLADEKTAFNYRIADGGKLKSYDIRIVDKEIVTTPLGKIEAIKLIRYREGENKRQTTLWCAPQLNYLPVKLEHTEKGGSVFTALLRRLKGIPTDDVFIPVQSKPSSYGQVIH
ncbi:isoprenoid biosynthesis protein [Methylophaga sp. 42_25_T18]|nr:isoprenoid biosynthesis protein [Methylophaga sp. 42_25_T18]OUR89866.1 isoprenoid biosynthesis protein [Methylophaga sp. 42_8_T64]